MPAVEVSEKDNEVCVCAELPGLRPEDVTIEATGDELIIQGETEARSGKRRMADA
jgi:HSP20 family protein